MLGESFLLVVMHYMKVEGQVCGDQTGDHTLNP